MGISLFWANDLPRWLGLLFIFLHSLFGRWRWFLAGLCPRFPGFLAKVADMKHFRLLGVLSLLGGVTAVALLIVFAQTGFGAPGTAVYQRYELLNRLMAVALLFMVMGWIGVWQMVMGYGRLAALLALIGNLVIASGSAAEFWLYADLPYAGENMRQAAFTAVGIGAWLLDIGATVLGIFIWCSQIWPRWFAFILLLALPIDFAAFFWLNSPSTAATVMALVVSVLTMKQQKQ